MSWRSPGVWAECVRSGYRAPGATPAPRPPCNGRNKHIDEGAAAAVEAEDGAGRAAVVRCADVDVLVRADGEVERLEAGALSL
jgi:hypothetical protein